MISHMGVQEKWINRLEWIIIIGFAIIPLFMNFPYRVNIFLSWEGAYRLYLGQIPYRDFGLPMGFGFWVIPALFFKLFGPYLITLVKAQVFINIISGLAFRSILISLSVNPSVRLLSVLVYVISYSFFNFWPWYDQSVIVFEIIGLAFLLKHLFQSAELKWKLIHLALSAVFLFWSFFTKQDGGGMALLIALSILFYHSLQTGKFRYLILFCIFYIVIALLVILPFLPYGFAYWFNYGQPPHNARLSLYDVVDVFLGESTWIKFYLFIIVVQLIPKISSWKIFYNDPKEFIFALLTLGILAEAIIFQVTSYTPPDNNIFFHAFAFAFIFSHLPSLKQALSLNAFAIVAAMICILLWWSATGWKYTNRIVRKAFHINQELNYNIVSMHTYMLPDPSDTLETNPDMTTWIFCKEPIFKGIYMPVSTAEGVNRLIQNAWIKENGKKLKVLNMTELTPLAEAIGYRLETGSNIPLWYHKGVAMFDSQIQDYQSKIQQHVYDLVMFEYIPRLNNFYPFSIRDELYKYYVPVDSFSGPRRGMYSMIEVFVSPENKNSYLSNNHP
ncbi:hypothetical protein [Thermoflavifilum thermophilum]|uniref:Dolichyl-phosphate-mannose-protein mannosyltransferase n=1 Tax=Thermoflavifilum thermophilum TaxID=1393122 RepID=A0A1I7NER1_9BACT|nr:hypothetical protein [Thermoflavifilum thermophilum]SFV33036.1 hypothetical protein SAMN05660895_1535 [Thermoflavifilum thermophilum]